MAPSKRPISGRVIPIDAGADRIKCYQGTVDWLEQPITRAEIAYAGGTAETLRGSCACSQKRDMIKGATR